MAVNIQRFYNNLKTEWPTLMSPWKRLVRLTGQRLCCFVSQHDYYVVFRYGGTPISIGCACCEKRFPVNILKSRALS